MAKNHARAKVNIPICLAGVLLCLTMFSLHLAGGIVARYTTTTDGADNARVIEFEQLTVADTTPASNIVIPGVPISWNPNVSFGGSESATYLFLEVYLTNGSTPWQFDAVGKKTFTALYHDDHINDNGTDPVPGLTWTLADGWSYLEGSSNPYVYYRDLTPNDPQSGLAVIRESKLTVASTLLAGDLLKINHTGGNLGIKFAASVVQSNGFASVQAAWNSLESSHGRTP